MEIYLKSEKIIPCFFKNIFFFLVYSIFSANLLLTQNFSLDSTQNEVNLTESKINDNYVKFGFEKIINTYLFHLYGNYEQKTNFGNFSIKQNYKSSAFITSTNLYRDDELFQFEYLYPLYRPLELGINQKWLYSSDSRSFGLNKLQRLNGQLKLKVNFFEKSFITLAFGPEKNTTLQHSSDAYASNIEAYLEEINFSNFSWDAKLNGEYLRLDLNRNNSDLELLTNFKIAQNPNNVILLNFGLKILDRDFLLPLILKNNLNQIENRNETNARLNLKISYSLFENLYFDGIFGISNIAVSRNYKYEQEENNTTKVKRDLQDFQFNINSSLTYKNYNFSLFTGIIYSSRQELNTISPIFTITDEELSFLRNNESQRDNYSNRTRLLAKAEWEITPSDTLKFEQSFSLLQYDTPSKLNNDDRDEFSSISSIYYAHRFSKVFSSSISLEMLHTHLVYLKKERSAMNNWNRVIKLTNSSTWKNEFFSINPQFEVLANYTIFDFDKLNTNIKSYSFRQISYRDTICIYITKSISFQSQLLLKYFERGILIWKYFKENPQNSNFEQNIRTLFFITHSNYFSYGAGIKYFQTNLKDLRQNVFSTSLSYRINSIGPEAVIIFNFKNGSRLNLTCGYEFQTINNAIHLEIPNASLYTSINL